jgi:aryl-alcohol dehydrogenase-like predicted oxidoreductase
MTPQSHELDRRMFLKGTTVAAGAAVLAQGHAEAALPDKPGVKRPGPDGLTHGREVPGMPYVKLGRTSFNASRLVFGCGAALAGGKAVRLLDKALEAGINFYDIGSNVFYKGSENQLAPFMKANRDDIWVSSKAPVAGPKPEADGKLSVENGRKVAARWTKFLEDSLRDLQTEYIDAYYLMAQNEVAYVKCEELYAAFLAAREAGKVGYYGISTHNNTAAVIEAMIETGWYDLAMVGITPAGFYDWTTQNIMEARAAGIGLIGMKSARYLSAEAEGRVQAFDAYYPEHVMASGLDPFQRAYAYVLAHGMDIVNSDMQNFAHLEANIKAVKEGVGLFA